MPDDQRGGYPAGDKPPSELKPPPAALTTPRARLDDGDMTCSGCSEPCSASAPCRCCAEGIAAVRRSRATVWGPIPTPPRGRLVAGSVEPPHRCDPAQLWADLGGETRTIDDEEFPDADPSVRIECACGEQWEPVPPPSWWSYAGLYRDGWLRVVKPKPDEYPAPGLHPNREDIARARRTWAFWRWITRA